MHWQDASSTRGGVGLAVTGGAYGVSCKVQQGLSGWLKRGERNGGEGESLSPSLPPVSLTPPYSKALLEACCKNAAILENESPLFNQENKMVDDD